MSDAVNQGPANRSPVVGAVHMAIEVIVIPVSDVDRARRFYGDLGWSLDLDFDSGDGYRVVQATPPGSYCSVIFGSGVTEAAPGSVQGLHLVVSDIADARADLIGRGVKVSELFHDPGGIFHRTGAVGRTAGPNPKRQSYASYCSFTDPDGNCWTIQEITLRLTADIAEDEPRFTPELLYAARHPARFAV